MAACATAHLYKEGNISVDKWNATQQGKKAKGNICRAINSLRQLRKNLIEKGHCIKYGEHPGNLKRKLSRVVGH